MPGSRSLVPVGLAAACALLPENARAQFSEPRSLVDTVATPTALITLDVDRDGDMDLVSVASENGRLVWFEARGANGVGPSRTLIDGLSSPRDVAAGDADGDGDLDLLVSDAGNPSPLYFENLGSIAFAPPVPLTSLVLGLGPVALDDADADGDLDAVVLFPGGFGQASALFVLPNDGTGTFGAPTDVLPSQITQVDRAELRDIDGDGRTDAVLGRAFIPDSILYLRSTPGGTLAPPVVLSAQFGDFPFDVGDVDGDGDVDLVTGRSGVAVVHLNDGAGQLGPPTTLPNSSRLPEAVFLVDLDLDGDEDVLLAQGPQPRLVLHESLGGGAFGTQRTLSTHPLSDFEVAVAADLDADGALDVAVGTGPPLLAADPDQIGVWRGNGLTAPPFLQPPTRLTAPLPGAFDATALDLDGDGDRDVVGSSLFPNRVVSFEARGAAEFDAFVDTSLGPLLLFSVTGGDFDRDGRDDLLTVQQSGPLAVHPSAGGGAFDPAIVLEPSVNAGADPIVLDVDGDGALDVIAADSSTRISWYRNLGAGAWAPALPIDATVENPSGFAAGDLDGDGDVDLVVVTRGPFSGVTRGEVVWYEWNGASFGAGHPITSSIFDLAGLAVGDVDADGMLDIVWGPGIEWARGLGGGAFAPPAGLVSGLTVSVAQLALIDADADEVDDLVVLDEGGALGWYENDGSGNFAAPVVPIETAVERLRIADVDLDGDDDLIAIQPAASEIAWVENRALGAVGVNYCGPAVPNATGAPGRIEAVGSDLAGANVLTLRALELPPNAFGFFLNSRAQGLTFPVAGWLGRLCLSGPIGRYVGPDEVGFSGEDGFFTLRLDLPATPTPNGFVVATAGQTWNFQAWHRDVAVGGATSNFTDAVSLVLR